MRIDAGFTQDMIDLLASMKGKTFKSYECNGLGRFGIIHGSVRFNLGRFAIDVALGLHVLEEEPGGFDEVAWFSCEKSDLNSEFVPGVVAEPRQYLVNEIVTGVEIVRDRVEYGDDYPAGACLMLMDVALVVRTKYHTYTFSRDLWYDDIIELNVGAAGEPAAEISSINKLWIEGERVPPDVKRETLML